METDKNIIDIPFSAFDSELGGFEYTIPEGFEAEIKDGKVIMRKKDSEDERIRKMLVEQMKNWRKIAAENCVSEDIKDANAALDWLENHTYPNHLIEDFLLYVLSYGKGGWGEEKQKEQKLSTPKYRVGEVMRTKQEAAEGITDGLPVIVSMDDNYYYCTNEKIPISEQDEYEFPPMNMRQQPGKWSEEDEKCLQTLIDYIGSEQTNIQKYGKKKSIAWLKSLRPQPHWKPSEEQMHYLLAVIIEPNNAGSESCHLVLKGLYEQLKKLM